MKIVNIFAVVSAKLFAVQFESDNCDAFTLAFRQWNDTEYLEDYFQKNKSDLDSDFYHNSSVEEAIFSTIDQAIIFESKIREVAETGNFETGNSLQDIVFKPLHKNDNTYKLQESKAYGSEVRSWLRLYAVRISAECFVVSGSAIKLTAKMNERTHTLDELAKLKTVATYLRENGLLEDDDFGYVDIINLNYYYEKY